MKKIVFVSANNGGGGSEELWVQTACRLRHLGHSVTAVTEWGESAQKRINQLNKGEVQHHSLNPYKHAFWRIVDRALNSVPWSARSLKIHLRRIAPDLVVFNSGTLIDGIALLETVHAAGHPCVVVTHLVSETNWPKDELAGRIHQAFTTAIEATFVSEHNRNLYIRQTGHALANAHIVRNPFLVRPVQSPTPVISQEDIVRLALPARLHPRTKGQDILFDVLSRPEWRQRHVQVTLFGEGECERTLRALCHEYDLNNKIVFAGQVNDIEKIWSDHHGLILPSRHEGLPIALIEAMWSGRVVIATPAGGIPEMIEHGRTGFLAKACTCDALAQAMEEAWHQRSQWSIMGNQAHQLVKKHIPEHPARVWADRLLALIEKSAR